MISSELCTLTNGESIKEKGQTTTWSIHQKSKSRKKNGSEHE